MHGYTYWLIEVCIAVILSSVFYEHILCYGAQLLIMEILRFVPISNIRARNQRIDFFSVCCISFLFVFILMHVFKTECIYFLLFFVGCQRIFHAPNSFPLTKPPWAACNNWKTSGMNAECKPTFPTPSNTFLFIVLV